VLIVLGDCGSTAVRRVIVQPDDCPLPLASPIERPVAAVGIDEVREPFELVPLLFVVLALQLRRVRPEPRRFKLDISADQAAGIDRPE
jgi:hypothetical protein